MEVSGQSLRTSGDAGRTRRQLERLQSLQAPWEVSAGFVDRQAVQSEGPDEVG